MKDEARAGCAARSESRRERTTFGGGEDTKAWWPGAQQPLREALHWASEEHAEAEWGDATRRALGS